MANKPLKNRKTALANQGGNQIFGMLLIPDLGC